MSTPERATRCLVFFLALAVLAFAPALADDERIDKLEQEIQELRELLAAAKGASGELDSERLGEIERKIEVLANELEDLRIGEAAIKADTPLYGFGPAASKVYRVDSGVSIGGYGEMLYQNFDSDTEGGDPSGKKDEIDFLRGVLYFGYKFNERWIFNSEIEFEHASTSEEGSASVEFAYLDYLWRPEINPRVGLLLVPMGFLNELHEPTLFLSAKRPVTESVIIPSTWRENGAGVFGDLGPVSYRSYIVNGLEGEDFTARGLRGGRQKGSEASAEDFAWVTRFDYVGVTGLTVGGSYYYGDSGQDLGDPDGGQIEISTKIWELHAEFKWKALQTRFLTSTAELDDVAALNDFNGFVGDESVGEELVGTYLEVGYDVLHHRQRNARLIPFVRWEEVNTQDKVPTGFAADPANDQEIITAGLAFQPIDQIIFKLDYQDISNEADSGVDQINFGLGYVF